MARVNKDYTFIRGDSFGSDKWIISYDPQLAADAPSMTWDEILAALDAGTYTAENLSSYNITGQARLGYTDVVLFPLVIVKNTWDFYFQVPKEDTESLPNEITNALYDIQLVHTGTGWTTTWVAGKLVVTPDVTYV